MSGSRNFMSIYGRGSADSTSFAYIPEPHCGAEQSTRNRSQKYSNFFPGGAPAANENKWPNQPTITANENTVRSFTVVERLKILL
jgi:hypothetical protein